MHLIVLSGGSGKRLWPLSNDVRSKQFLKLLRDKKGEPQSMVQRVLGQIRAAQPDADITIATNISQLDSVRAQLENVDIVIEPERRDTFPAIALACEYLAYEKSVKSDETIIVLPCDPFTEDNFFHTLSQLDKIIQSNGADIALIGIKPVFPTAKYGYILPKTETRDVPAFAEKPDEITAAKLIQEGALWNAGVFAFKLGYILERIPRPLIYSELPKISFDYHIVEKSNSIAVVPYFGKWSDIGSWRTLTDELPNETSGAVVANETKNTYVINELNIPVVTLGTKNLVVVASYDGILVSDLVASSHLKPVVEKLDNTRPMYEERRWGDYAIVAREHDSLVKKLFLREGKSISYQKHLHRDEVWVVTTGKGELMLDGELLAISSGDTIKIKRGQKHSVKAITDLNITEVQLGEILSEEDIERYDR